MNTQQINSSIIDKEKKQIQDLLQLTQVDIELNEVGWTSRVYICNKGEYVFKFPRSEEVKREYEQEIKILTLLHNLNNSVQVPHLIWVGDELKYLGYKGIVGQTVDLVVENLSKEQKSLIGKQIGMFLTELHSIKPQDMPIISIQDEIKQFQNSYQVVLPVLCSQLKASEQLQLKELMVDEMPATITQLGNDSVLCHGDLGYWNIIISKQSKVGIIDWGDIGYYDRSKDFIGLEDKEIFDSALSAYGDNRNIREKIKIRQRVLPILDLKYYFEINDKEKIHFTINKLIKNL